VARRTVPDAPVSPLELHAWRAGRAVVGVDEVGRGAWAGPVTVGAVVLDPTRLPTGVRDSKTLTPAARTAVASRIRAHALVGLGSATPAEIDALGLAAALRLAVGRALDTLAADPRAPSDPLVLIDGPHDLLRRDGVEVATLVRGDAHAVSIAAASVVAKVFRDDGMRASDGVHPGYGFARNRGYPSPEHRAALARLGPCAAHRRSWAPFRTAQGQLPGTAASA